MLIRDVKKLTLDYFVNTPLGMQIESLFKTFEKVQKTLYNLTGSKDESGLLKIRTGTVLIFEVINKSANGTTPNKFTNEDWREIASRVVDNAINVDEERYSEMVFLSYADYIDVSAEVISTYAPSDKVEAVKLLARDLREKTELLQNESISESAYIESCLWISLEAMVKLIVVTIGQCASPEIRQFIDGASVFAFEYGRLVLYSREQQLVTQFLEHQNEVNNQLTEKYDKYIYDLNQQSEIFMSFIEDAFHQDIRQRLMGSVELARNVGVEEEEILDSLEKIDDFFL